MKLKELLEGKEPSNKVEKAALDIVKKAKATGDTEANIQEEYSKWIQGHFDGRSDTFCRWLQAEIKKLGFTVKYD